MDADAKLAKPGATATAARLAVPNSTHSAVLLPTPAVLPLHVAGGHAGYEVAPFLPTIEQLVSLAVVGPRPCDALNTVRHHDMHHRFPRTHFSLYMTHWDRLCGTEHPQYRADVAAHFGDGHKTAAAVQPCGRPTTRSMTAAAAAAAS